MPAGHGENVAAGFASQPTQRQRIGVTAVIGREKNPVAGAQGSTQLFHPPNLVIYNALFAPQVGVDQVRPLNERRPPRAPVRRNETVRFLDHDIQHFEDAPYPRPAQLRTVRQAPVFHYPPEGQRTVQSGRSGDLVQESSSLLSFQADGSAADKTSAGRSPKLHREASWQDIRSRQRRLGRPLRRRGTELAGYGTTIAQADRSPSDRPR